MGVLTFPSGSFCITGLFGHFSISYCMSPERFKVKQHTFFCKENKFKLKIVRHAFLSLGDLGYSPCQFRPCWSRETWLSGLCISFRTTPQFISDLMPTPHIYRSAYFLFYYNLGFAAGRNSQGFHEEYISETRVGMASSFHWVLEGD